ncbi:MAG: tetratricopeptide repeat protein [Emcibacter sp.]|nr:tetratricopeptide repeat protein [Emcibacter sp.]
MNWLVLLITSAVSSSIIMYALWPSSSDNNTRKIFAVSIALVALFLPVSLNYYYTQSSSTMINSEPPSYTPPTQQQSVWTGGTRGTGAAMPDQGSVDMGMSAVISRLEEKLAQNPNNLNGWILLGRSYVAIGETEKAITVFKAKLIENPENPNLLMSYGESLAKLNEGMISQEAQTLFAKALAIEPNNPRAIYNVALYDLQKGHNQKAYDSLNALLDSAPEENTAWRSQIMESINIAAVKLGLKLAPSETSIPNPTAEQAAAINNLSSEDKNAFIRNMVDGLATKLKDNPNDFQGWLRLGRSYSVLDDQKNAAFAYQQALKLSPNDEAVKKLYQDASAKASQ